MPRPPRYEPVGYPQHVIQRGTDRCRIFLQRTDLLHFRYYLADACDRYDCRVHAYVLMSNHVHVIMTPDREHGVSRVMHLIGTRYVQYFNRIHRRTGALWQGRYKGMLIDTDRYLLACYRYIELNPVRAGLVPHPGDYPWSSYAANANGERDPLVHPHLGYYALGRDEASRRAAYCRLFESELDPLTLRAIRESARKGCPLGSWEFRERVARLSPGRIRSGSDPKLETY